jgi:hypothetical protein
MEDQTQSLNVAFPSLEGEPRAPFNGGTLDRTDELRKGWCRFPYSY